MEQQLCLWQYSSGLPEFLQTRPTAQSLNNSGNLNNYNKL